MDILEKRFDAPQALRLSVEEDGVEVGRASLFFITNDLHDEPYAVLEDVFVEESHRGKGIGTALSKKAIEKAEELGCRKLLAQSRYGREKVHALYESLGFRDYGKNFRIDFITD